MSDKKKSVNKRLHRTTASDDDEVIVKQKGESR